MRTPPSKPYLANRVRSLYADRHLEEPAVHHSPCEDIELRLEEEVEETGFLLDVDGEPLGSLPLAVKVMSNPLRARA